MYPLAHPSIDKRASLLHNNIHYDEKSFTTPIQGRSEFVRIRTLFRELGEIRSRLVRRGVNVIKLHFLRR
jgi:hypothetical protein